MIELRPLTITWRGLPIARLFADGRTEALGQTRPGPDAVLSPGPTLRADGTIALTRSGWTARVDERGDIFVVEPGPAPRHRRFGRVSNDQLSLARSTQTWTARVEGSTLVFNGPDDPNYIQGSVDAGARHTVLVMTAAFMIDAALGEP